MHAVKCLLLGLRPMLEQKEAIAKYIDPHSKLKVNMGKLLEEAIAYMMNPMKGKKVPFFTLLLSCFDRNAFAGFPTEPLKDIVNNQGFDLQPYLDLMKQLGLFENSQNPKETEMPKQSGMKSEDRVALESISDEQRERYLLLADAIAHADVD